MIGSYSYTYDGTGRRIGAVETGTTITYTYDALYRLTDAIESTGSVYHYAYDAAGNRLLKQEPGINQAAAYDAANQLVTVGGMSAVYDDNGNLLDDGTQTYQYDSLDQLIRVTQGISVTAYGYTGDGDRLWQNTDGVTTTFTLDLNSALAQVLAQSQGGQTSRFLPGIGQETNGVWAYTHSDALGSVRHLTGMAGTHIGSVKYSPFGEIVNSTGMAAWYGFTGEPQEGTNGLTYLRARYYNPALGRFLTPDSLIPDVTNGQALNAYAYVYNDPINLVDPSGNIGIWPVMPTSIIKFSAQKGLDFLDWWDSKPEDCDCNQNPSYIVDVTKVLGIGANYLSQVAWGKATTPAKMVASTVAMYKRAPVPSAYRTLSNVGYRVVGIQHNVDVTGWYKGGAGYTSKLLDGSSGKGAALLHSNSGKKALYLRDMKVDTSPGMTGFAGSIVGAGLIDSLFQLLGDWASNLCLSPEQYALRMLIALEFGLLAGVFGAAAGVAAVVYAGASAVAAAGVSIGVGYFASQWLDNLKKDYLSVIETGY